MSYVCIPPKQTILTYFFFSFSSNYLFFYVKEEFSNWFVKCGGGVVDCIECSCFFCLVDVQKKTECTFDFYEYILYMLVNLLYPLIFRRENKRRRLQGCSRVYNLKIEKKLLSMYLSLLFPSFDDSKAVRFNAMLHYTSHQHNNLHLSFYIFSFKWSMKSDNEIFMVYT